MLEKIAGGNWRFRRAFFEQNVYYSENYCDFQQFLSYFLIKSNFNSEVTLSLMFSQSFFEKKMSPYSYNYCDFQRFLLFQNKARNAGRSGENAGNKPKCRISHVIVGRLTPMDK